MVESKRKTQVLFALLTIWLAGWSSVVASPTNRGRRLARAAGGRLFSPSSPSLAVTTSRARFRMLGFLLPSRLPSELRNTAVGSRDRQLSRTFSACGQKFIQSSVADPWHIGTDLDPDSDQHLWLRIRPWILLFCQWPSTGFKMATKK